MMRKDLKYSIIIIIYMWLSYSNGCSRWSFEKLGENKDTTLNVILSKRQTMF